ncbi:MAG: cation:proton antiporter [Actinomycetota bacterium]|nr:cation:proton antiporter [Actinomycetota bacterium]
MIAALVFLILGLALLLAVVLPTLLVRVPLSAPMVLVLVGGLIGLLPIPASVDLDPLQNLGFIEHFTEFTVLVALMGVGLALDRPLSLLDRRSWHSWSATWKLIGIAMPLCIAAVFGLGWGLLGLTPAAAMLLGAALSPTDPVLASDVQVAGPTVQNTEERQADQARADGTSGEQQRQEDPDAKAARETVDERDEVRFALTSEAGLNDGLAFPFVFLAIFLAGSTGIGHWGWGFLAWNLVGKIVIGVVVGVGVGWLLARIAFRSRSESLRVAERGDPLLALAVLLVVYGCSEVAGGYGFLAVFCAAMTMRATERRHQYNAAMHQVVERLERLFTLVILLLLGVALTHGLLSALDWRGLLIALVLTVVIRPLAGLIALAAGRRGLSTSALRGSAGNNALQERRERLVTAFFGVRGVGSLYYLAYACGHAKFSDQRWLWSTVTLTLVSSVVIHGILATPAMAWLGRHRERLES